MSAPKGLKIGDTFVENNFGHQLLYKVVDYHPLGYSVEFVKEITAVKDTTVETMIEEIKEMQKPVEETVEKPVEKKSAPKPKTPNKSAKKPVKK